MLGSDSRKFDWETREDAETLIRAKQIQADPDRLSKASECINDSLQNTVRAIQGKPSFMGRRSNRATLKKLDV